MAGTRGGALEATLDVFDARAAPAEPLTTSEVASALSISRRSAYDRLDRLVDRGELATKKVGARGRVWWLPPGDGGTTPGADGAAGAATGPAGADEPSLERLVDDVPGVFYRCRNDAGRPMSYVSAGCEELTGYDPAAVEAGEVSWGADVIHPGDRERVREEIAAQLADGSTFTLQYRVMDADGGTRWVAERGYLADEADGSGHLEGVVNDVTERRQVEEALSRQEQQFRSMVEATEEYAIFLLNADGRVTTWNAGAERIKGYAEEEIVGEHVSAFYAEADRDARVPEWNLAAAARDGSVEDEGWRVRADGSRFWANVTITAIREDGELRGFAKVTRDMTERREYEEQLRAERDLIDRIFDTAPVGIATYGPDGELRRVNDQAVEMFGLDEGAATDFTTGDIRLLDADGEPLSPRDQPVARALATGEAVAGQEIKLERDGAATWFSVNATPVAGDGGAVERVVATATDVTRLKEQARRLERRQRELAAELDEVYERVDGAFFALSGDWEFTYVNDRAAALIDADEGELLGRTVWDAYPAAEDSPFEERFRRAMAEQEAARFEAHFDPLDAWFEFHAYPSETGLSVYFRDVTDRKERERALAESERRYRTLAENFPNGGVGMYDADLRYTLVEGTMWDDIDPDPADLEGRTVREALPPDTADDVEPVFRAALEGETGSTVSTLDGRTYRVWAAPVRDADGEVTAGQSIALDITERVERERDLERYETIVEAVEDGIYALDDDGRFILVNDAFCELVGRDRDELLGEPATLVHPDDKLKWEATELAREVAAGERDSGRIEAELARGDGETVPVETALRPLALADGFGRCGVVRDVTDRLERERERERRTRQQEAVAELGQLALETDDLDRLFDRAAERVAETLDTAHTSVLERLGDDRELLLRAGAGWDDFRVGDELLLDDSVTQAAYTLASEEPVVARDLAAESRFEPSDVLAERGVVSNVSVAVGSADDPWGVLATHATERREFTANDVNFVKSVANVLATAIDRVGRERELERRREQLRALNSLNEVVRETTDAVVEQSTREEIEAAVCEHLAAAESYEFAWIGEVDTSTDTVDPRTEAGVEGYLDGVTISVDPDDERSRGPAGTALRTGDVQVSREFAEDPRIDPWRDHVSSLDARSAAAIPISHEGTIYGVLAVYADRADAFSGQEREVVGQLGEVVGHAIAAVQRKRALTSDEVVELEFRIPDALAALDLPDDIATSASLDRSVPLGDDEYLLYGTTTDDGLAALEAIAAELPHWTDVTVIDDSFGEVTFEVALDEPPLLSVAADHGATVPAATFEGGDFRLTVHLPRGGDVQRLIEAIRDVFPSAEAMARRQVPRSSDPADRVRGTWVDDLTERQRSALETAYFAGYFEWPRDSSGQEVAEKLGISSATLSQHLRNAESKLLDALFDELSAGE